MIPTRTINQVTIRPVPLPPADTRPVLGGAMLPLLYSNTAIIARKKSGKTMLLYRILEACTDRRTSVILIAPTVHKDPTYAAILKMLHRRSTPVTVFEDLHEDGESVLDQLMERLQAPDSDEELPEATLSTRMFGACERKRGREPLTQAPRYVLVIDDCSHALRTPSVATLLKKHRHLGMRVLISTHSVTDLTPSSWKQIDTCILMRGVNFDKLETLYNSLDLHVTLDRFITMYDQAVLKPFSFLTIDSRADTYRINFNEQFQI
jgi:hypothetical protein